MVELAQILCLMPFLTLCIYLDTSISCMLAYDALRLGLLSIWEFLIVKWLMVMGTLARLIVTLNI